MVNQTAYNRASPPCPRLALALLFQTEEQKRHYPFYLFGLELDRIVCSGIRADAGADIRLKWWQDQLEARTIGRPAGLPI